MRTASSAAFASLASVVTAVAQCNSAWSVLEPTTGRFPATDGSVYSSAVFDPDGAGPIGPRVAVSGDFAIAGDFFGYNLGAVDPATGAWHKIGVLGTRTQVASRTNGELYMINAGTLQRWTGSFWTAALTYSGSIEAMRQLPDGGLALLANNTALSRSEVLRFDGADAVVLGHFASSPYTPHIAVQPDGAIVLMGEFTSVSGVAAQRLARYRNGVWSQVGPGMNFSEGYLAPTQLIAMTDGSIVIFGDFVTNVNGVAVNRIARWNGTGWTSMGAGISYSWYGASFAALPNGALVVSRGTPGQPGSVSRWNGTAWQPLDAADSVQGLATSLTALPDGRVLALGGFGSVNGVMASGKAIWNGTTWEPVGSDPTEAFFSTVVEAPDGDLYVGVQGQIRVASGGRVSSIARFDGTAFQPVGAPIRGVVNSIIPMPNGDVWVSGSIQLTLGGPYVRVARWNGAAWSEVGSLAVPPGSSEVRLLRHASGTVYAFGDGLGVRTWNGSAWVNDPSWDAAISTFVTYNPHFTPSFYDVVALPNGRMYASGRFVRATGGWATFACFDGTSWTAGAAEDQSAQGLGLAALPDGRIIAAYRSQPSGYSFALPYVRLYTGASYTSMTPTPFFVRDFAVLSDGSIYAGGSGELDVNISGDRAARWTGQVWQDIDTTTYGKFDRLFALSDDSILFTGPFAGFHGWLVARNIVRYTPAAGVSEFASQPQPASVAAGSPALFGVTLTTPQAVTYAWRRNLVPISTQSNPSAATSTLLIASVTEQDVGAYDCIVTSTCGSRVSQSAQLTIGGGCDSIDFNNNQVFPEDQDIVDFFDVLSGADCPTCNDIDFNNNQVFPEDQDVIDFFTVLAGGECP